VLELVLVLELALELVLVLELVVELAFALELEFTVSARRIKLTLSRQYG